MRHLKLLLLFAFCSTFWLPVFAQYENLYIIGGPFNAHNPNWLHGDVVQLEKDSENPYIFYYRGYIGYNTFGDEPGNFKILISNNSWEGYHPDGHENQLIGATQVGTPLAMREGGDDTKWFVPEDRTGDGYYVIKVDTENNTFLIESFMAASSTEVPVGLFLIGGPFIIDNLNWSERTDVIKMERDDTDPDVFHFRGYMECNQWGVDPDHFKILVNAREWGNEFHPEGDDDLSFTDLIAGQASTIVKTEDKKWYLPEDGSGNGYWDFSVDAKNLTLTVNEFIHDFDYFEEVYITGDAMPCGWTDSNPEVMTKESRGVYFWTGIVNTGEFKFLKHNNSYNGCYVTNSTEGDEYIVLDEEYDITYEKNYTKHDSGSDYKFVIGEENANKEVSITLDLDTKKMTIVAIVDDEEEDDDNGTTTIDKAQNQLANVFSAEGKVLINGVANENYTTQIFNIAGRQITQKNFVGNIEITLPQGCYLISLSNKLGNTTKTKVVVF